MRGVWARPAYSELPTFSAKLSTGAVAVKFSTDPEKRERHPQRMAQAIGHDDE